MQYGFFIFYYNNEIDIKKPKKFFTMMLMRIFLMLNILFQKVLTIPIMVTCLSMFQCSTDVKTSQSMLTNYPTLSCSDPWFYVNACLAFFTLTLFLLLVFLNCMFLNDNRPISVLPWSGPKNPIQFVYVSLKIVLSVFYVFSAIRPYYDIKIFIILAVIAVIIGCRIWNPLYHQSTPFCLEVIMEGMFLFVAILAIINYYISLVFDIQTLVSEILIGVIFGYALLKVIQQTKSYFLNIDVSLFVNVN